jgi:hypothetical protein
MGMKVFAPDREVYILSCVWKAQVTVGVSAPDVEAVSRRSFPREAVGLDLSPLFA